MASHPMKLVTIICEELARDTVLELIKRVGGRGFTCFKVEGWGEWGYRTGETPELSNVQIEVLVGDGICERLMNELEDSFFAKYSLVVFESDVKVRRKDRF